MLIYCTSDDIIGSPDNRGIDDFFEKRLSVTKKSWISPAYKNDAEQTLTREENIIRSLNGNIDSCPTHLYT